MRWSKDPDQDYVVQWKESYCRCQLHPVCSENVVRGYILTLLDITQQKKETVLMEDLKKKAEEQSFLKSRFLASVSHDLRSPLHAIIGGSDILKRQNLPDESKNILEYIRVAGNNLLEHVSGVAGGKPLLRAGKAEKFCVLSAGAGPGRNCVIRRLRGGRAVGAVPVGRK